LRKTSTDCRLSLIRCKVLIKATISERWRRFGFRLGLRWSGIRNCQHPNTVRQSYSHECFIVQFKQDFECRANARNLKLAPKSALITAGAVQNSRDVPKVVLELIAEFLRRDLMRAGTTERKSEMTYYCIIAPEQGLFVKPACATHFCHIEYSTHFLPGFMVFFESYQVGCVPCGFNVVRLEVWRSTGYCPKKKHCIEVNV
jgi:hypothetical protein